MIEDKILLKHKASATGAPKLSYSQVNIQEDQFNYENHMKISKILKSKTLQH